MYCINGLGRMGRFGNQLFQYAFVRSLARKHKTQFFCPPWLGDRVLTLNDSHERATTPINDRVFHDKHKGHDPEAESAPNGTDFVGNFESYKYFASTQNEVREWYRFRPEITDRVRRKYGDHDFARMACFHLRFGDYQRFPWKLAFFTPSARYFKEATHLLGLQQVAVFSDDLPAARSRLRNVSANLLFIEGNEDWEDLFLMTLCKYHVISSSTFSWWGAWLSKVDQKIVIRPAEGRFRPGSQSDNGDFYPADWRPVPALTGSVAEQYRFLKAQYDVINALSMPGRFLGRTARGIVRRARSLKVS